MTKKETEDETTYTWVLPVQVSYGEAFDAAKRGDYVWYYDRSPTGMTSCVQCYFDKEVGAMYEDHPTIPGDYLIVPDDPDYLLFIFPKETT